MLKTNPETSPQLFGIQPPSDDAVIILCASVCVFIATTTLNSLDVSVRFLHRIVSPRVEMNDQKATETGAH